MCFICNITFRRLKRVLVRGRKLRSVLLQRDPDHVCFLATVLAGVWYRPTGGQTEPLSDIWGVTVGCQRCRSGH